jgi:hypothetical protein
LLAPIHGSSLEKDLYRQGCGTFIRPSNMTEAYYEMNNRNNLGLYGDALLYLGPRDQMLIGPKSPDLYLDLDFKAELERRFEIMTGGQKWDGVTPADNPAVDKPFFRMKASPGTQVSLRNWIESLENGNPNYDELTPELAEIERRQMPITLGSVRSLGNLKSITFQGVSMTDYDIYSVIFAHGERQLGIYPLTDSGKVPGISGHMTK